MAVAAYDVVKNKKYWQIIVVVILSLIVYFVNYHNEHVYRPPCGCSHRLQHCV
jgi:hypothetical protein